MKLHKLFYKWHRQQKVFFLGLLTVLLFSVLKLFNVERLVFIHRDIYLVEPELSTSDYVRNKFSSYTNESKMRINCSQIYAKEPVETGKSLALRRRNIIDLEDEDVEAMTRNCKVYRRIRGYHLKPVTLEEKNFPLAYSLVIHKSAVSVERLIRAIYSPANVYCIHYDQKSSAAFKAAIESLVKCFNNVFIASKLEAVTYAHISRLQADLNCLSDLLNSLVQWKYAINLCGQDLPLKSNFELVSELKKLNGENMLETGRPSSVKKERYMYQYTIKSMLEVFIPMPVRTAVSKEPPPHDIEMFVGSAYFVLSQAFIQYVFESPLAKKFLAWSVDTFSPDEHFWATLVRLPGIPGEIPRAAPDVTDLQSKTRLVKWIYMEEYLYPPCTGTHLRSVCIYGAAELRWLLKSGHWFANKFDAQIDPVIIKCLTEVIDEQQWQWFKLSSEEVFIRRTIRES
ncbi:beta-1,3-galactosyl-O-glycosyl-glycoprotein beta-1,6-N-acetylglucosaminyltransferase 4 [Microcaecilia unicolor]|uniref:Beta-1,3-galactosyl-O-glycosyl-glycoprotein beta-1,6-N-acetylglucosaminyltransferase 4 n=1 Tax=Microcaecilia unicolor TaxID=1415580 RepID=A0A6P7X761_9AMPH|nr:beta-1,3-galactosyl-O-glycosyl-glycoprotein beta-1,6-N-acetylglucosaminyltransferase 4 [Microcaecilia unicolor]XP_030049133.1 beta-1,3-galactosyl-O-glycosyl-glycoprotein beta-1,6-N-acetylglucosaminyltransferase 4 [Microcaecilia unicolor]XP_030049134.1 beta-1,3-galactosyl-O-glycosyl-glycoprotein beta-1,6-N-acetylglucosaminyltransferase 4 [Microcaecilia unicolor]XP_030049135.1 beta-1,3-galactosyl-O-glycosyl-glycoprotein beta-1,6-N-acetylglucosaminyltransferase 4 [Microcaecilia unicolor]XP_0300